MATLCPITGTRVVYLDCLECEEKICKTERKTRPVKNHSVKYRCNCCGLVFEEPNGVFEKLRCPNCDAVFEEDHDYIEKLEDE